MRISGNQRWAAGAITLCLLIACSPPADQTPAPAPPAVEMPAEEAVVPPGVAVSAAPTTDPGYWGAWAATPAACADASQTFLFSGEIANLTPQKRNCAVKDMREEHPTGRSAVYTLTATCISDPPGTSGAGDTIKLNFGASDTVMQIEVNSDPPLRLERCPKS